MRIGILTVPFNNNYGGFLQAFALVQVLKKMGHEPSIINRRKNNISLLGKIKGTILFVFGKSETPALLRDYNLRRASKYTRHFVDKYLPLTKAVYRSEDLSQFDYDCYIAGSDQVWHYELYSPFIRDFFFGYLHHSKKPRLSYAASFGTDKREYSEEDRKICAGLLEEFAAISVRERSAVKMISDYFGVKHPKAEFVLDPTMLLPVDAYIELLKPYKQESQAPHIFSYVLGEKSQKEENEKEDVLREISRELGYEVIRGKAQTGRYIISKAIEPVEKWLALLYGSSFVFTDSFHGVVFSILFNKPFIVYGNVWRGKARFDSLLSLFGLQSRYISSSQELSKAMIEENIEWAKVNLRLKSIALPRFHSLIVL